MRITLVATAILIASSCAMADTLNDAVQHGLISNPDVLFNTAKTLSARQGIGVAKGGFYPTIDLAAGAGREESQNPTTAAIDLTPGGKNTLNRVESNIELRQKLFAGGAVVGEFQRTRFLWQAQQWKTQGIAEDLALDIVNRYLTVLMHQKLYQLSVENLNRHRPIFSMINDLNQSGLSRTSDLDQAKGRLAQAEANKISAEANLREAQINYAKAVGKWPEHLAWPKFPRGRELPPTLTKAIEIGLDAHPTVKSAYADVKEAKAQYAVALAAMYPNVDLVLSASRNRNLDGLTGQNNDKVAMVRMNYNLFRGGSDDAHIRETAYQVQEAYETKNKALVDLKESIRLSWNAYKSAAIRLGPLRRHVASSKQTLGAYEEQFKLNKRTLLDLLDSQNELYQAENDYVRGQLDEIFSRYRIINGMGKLIPYLHMKLPVNVSNNDVFSSAQEHILLNKHDMNDVPYPDINKTPLQVKRDVPTFEQVKLTPANVNNNSMPPTQVPLKSWYVSTGPCKTKQAALNLAHKLQSLGFNAHPALFNDGYDVLVGPYEYRGHAGNGMARLKEIAKVPGRLVTFQGEPRI
ncbi:MAG: agglutination protein [Legionella sp.]|nr:MAG: agglutination protein [Legionella sp.]